MSPGFFELLVILIVFGIPALVVIVALLVFAGGRRRSSATSTEDMDAIRDLYDGLSRMEQRIGSIETILLDRGRRE